MLSECCIQHVSKYGRLSSGHRTGKGQSPSQFPRRRVLKNVQTVGQLQASPMLVRSGLKSCMLGFSIMRTKNFQMSKLGLEKAEVPEIKCPHSLDHKESKRIPEKHLPLFHAASASMLLQSCPTLCDRIDGSPPGSPVPGILQARTLEWAAVSFSNA